MVLCPSPVEEADVRLLPPIFPATLIQRSRISHRPRGADPSANVDASSDSGRSTSHAGSSSSQATAKGLGRKASVSVPRSTRRFSAPSWSGSVGIGAGGAFFGGVGSAKAVTLWPFSGRSRKAGRDDDKKRILIMMSNTGGGHKASADAIKAVFQEKYGDKYEVVIVDMWKQHTPAPFNGMPDTYSFLVSNPFLWRFTYEFTNPKLIHVPYMAAVGALVSKGVNDAFDQYRPHLVVSVHPLMQHIPIRVLEQRIKRGAMEPTNFATVVTDFTTCHNTWFSPGATRCFVPTEFCRNLAMEQGLAPGQIRMHGLPIRPSFSRPLPRRPALRRSLGMFPDLPAVLLVGGGEGMGKLEDTVEQLDRKLGGSCQVVVICGRNKRLLERLQARPQGAGHCKIVACGFVDNIHEWMGACDAIITKAGPGTIAEALISGLPILLNGNVPCQEEGNIPYVIDNEVGAFETRPPQIAEIMARWLDPSFKEEFNAMARRSKALGRPEAVYRIVADLAELADKPFFDFGPATVLAGSQVKRSCCSGKKGLAVQPAAA